VSLKKIDPSKTLGLSFLINTTFVVVEFVAGLFANSLALVSDAAHNLTDSFSIFLAYLAEKVSKKGASDKKTYGYGRVAVLAATINSIFLLATSAFVFSEAYQRLQNPQDVRGGAVAIIAAIGIISNGTIAYITSRNRKELNTKAVFMNNAVDTASSIGAVLAGIIILVTGKSWADSIISFGIAVLLLYAAWEIMREATSILLEGVPGNVDATKVKKDILSMQHVKGVDDLHIWTTGSNQIALSCHLVIEDCSVAEATKIVSRAKKILSKAYGIKHVTIETQVNSGPHDNERIDEGL